MIATFLLQAALMFGTCDAEPIDDPSDVAPDTCSHAWELEAYVAEVCASLPNMDSQWWAKPEVCDAYDRGVR